MLFLVWGSVLQAQTSFRYGSMPKLYISRSINSLYSLSVKYESRQTFSVKSADGAIDNKFNYLLSDIAVYGSRKIGLNNKLSGGYLISIRKGAISHRIVEQFTFITKLRNIRLGHRISSDQTFTEGGFPEIRLRYRVVSEFPLQGETVDINEFYLKISNEYLNSFQGGEYDLEVRLAFLPGFLISDINKIELGPDYRISSFIHNNATRALWIKMNWYIKI